MSLNRTFVNVSSNTTSSSARTSYIARLVILSAIIVVGVVGNSFVVTIVAMINSMKTTTNILLLNVAVADIITLLLTAIHVILSKTVAENSSFICKVIAPNTLSNVALLATVLTLTVLAIERYNALVKPMRISRRLTKENVLFVILGIWIISMAMTLPILIYLDFDPKIGCSPGRHFNSLLVSMGGIVIGVTIIPFVVIAFSYSQIISGLYFRNTICNSTSNPELSREDLIAKRKLVKLLVTITIVFFIAFVPFGVLQISIFSIYARQAPSANIINLKDVMVYLIPLHSSINPLLYTLQSRNYRDGFKVVVMKMICIKNQRWNIDGRNSVHRTPAAVSFRRDQVEL